MLVRKIGKVWSIWWCNWMWFEMWLCISAHSAHHVAEAITMLIARGEWEDICHCVSNHIQLHHQIGQAFWYFSHTLKHMRRPGYVTRKEIHWCGYKLRPNHGPPPFLNFCVGRKNPGMYTIQQEIFEGKIFHSWTLYKFMFEWLNIPPAPAQCLRPSQPPNVKTFKDNFTFRQLLLFSVPRWWCRWAV